VGELAGDGLHRDAFAGGAAAVVRMVVDGGEGGGADDKGREADCFSHLNHGVWT
jgi:hypothetical protein